MRDRDAVSQTVESYWRSHSELTFSLHWTCVHIYKVNMCTCTHTTTCTQPLVHLCAFIRSLNMKIRHKLSNIQQILTSRAPARLWWGTTVCDRGTLDSSSCADSTGCGQASIYDTAVSNCRYSLGFKERRLLWDKACLSFSSLPLVKGVILWTVAKVRTHGDRACSWSSLLHYSAVSLWLWRALAS